MADQKSIRIAKEQHTSLLFSKPNVVGVGMGYKQVAGESTNELCLVAMVRRKLPKAGLSNEDLVPPMVGGVKTDVLDVGVLRALQTRTDRWRPAPAGVSIGHFQVTAGTFGAQVLDRNTGEPLILSNNHVLANENDARIGDPILQPGAIDGGRQEDDTLARLERFVPIQFKIENPDCGIALTVARLLNVVAKIFGSKHRVQVVRANPQAVNQIDAAVAKPITPDMVKREILDIGVIVDVAQPTLGMGVRKSGRTSGYTTGEITVLEATVRVQYGDQREAQFEDQIVTSAMSAGGDSGSLLVSSDTDHAVGLLFAGSEQATIHNPIEVVLRELQVEF
jgi:hypothetical protein